MYMLDRTLKSITLVYGTENAFYNFFRLGVVIKQALNMITCTIKELRLKNDPKHIYWEMTGVCCREHVLIQPLEDCFGEAMLRFKTISPRDCHASHENWDATG